MSRIDKLMERSARAVAQKTSRRSVLAGIGKLLFGAALIPVLPVARADDESSGGYPGVGNQSSGIDGDPGDPTSCDYWRFCAIDGFLCGCCGGSANACPPGTEMSPITWIGTCLNPADKKHYIISYNDCCGKTSCGRCLCTRSEGDKPVYRPQANNDTNWCLGTKSSVYTCSTASVIGVATD
jgi:methylamine dehydrogenase light chain